MILTQQDYFKQCNIYLTLSSLSFLLPAFFSLYMKNIQMLIISSILCICSTLRWKYTTNSFLRTIDVTYVRFIFIVACFLHFKNIYDEKYIFESIFVLIMLLYCMIFYGLSWYFVLENQHNSLSLIFHILLHLYANFALLFSSFTNMKHPLSLF